MSKSIFYFHGFMSSAESSKAQVFKNFIEQNYQNINLVIPNIYDKFTEAIPQLDEMISKDKNKTKYFMGSSLGGFFASHYASLYKTKAVVINPAINPSEGLKSYLGFNENYANGNKFELTSDDIAAIKSIELDKINNLRETLLLCESGDEVLNYINAIEFYKGSFVNINFGGDHSYSCFSDKLRIISEFLEL